MSVLNFTSPSLKAGQMVTMAINMYVEAFVNELVFFRPAPRVECLEVGETRVTFPNGIEDGEWPSRIRIGRRVRAGERIQMVVTNDRNVTRFIFAHLEVDPLKQTDQTVKRGRIVGRFSAS